MPTQVVIQRKLVIIPYLNDQSGWDPKFSLVNTPEMLLKWQKKQTSQMTLMTGLWTPLLGSPESPALRHGAFSLLCTPGTSSPRPYPSTPCVWSAVGLPRKSQGHLLGDKKDVPDNFQTEGFLPHSYQVWLPAATPGVWRVIISPAEDHHGLLRISSQSQAVLAWRTVSPAGVSLLLSTFHPHPPDLLPASRGCLSRLISHGSEETGAYIWLFYQHRFKMSWHFWLLKDIAGF